MTTREFFNMELQKKEDIGAVRPCDPLRVPLNSHEILGRGTAETSEHLYRIRLEGMTKFWRPRDYTKGDVPRRK